MPNPLLSDRFVDFLMYDVLHVEELCTLPAFADHSRETFDMWMNACRRMARDVLAPAYRAMDAAPPRLENGEVHVPKETQVVWEELTKLGVIASTRPPEVGGQQVPLVVSGFATGYLMAGNVSAYAYAGLTTGAAHLIEAFGSDALKKDFMLPMYEGKWSGTMALTEPQAGSSLADVQTRATPSGDHFLLRGSKIFISGGGHDLTENIVHLVLARIDGAPAGTKGVSLFVVPRSRIEDGNLVSNDVTVSGLIHKIGWRGLPSVALSLGDMNDCHGYLVGEANAGLRCMFQMMNEARLMVGMNGAATASVAYHESAAYAQDRTQGRPIGVTDATTKPVPLVAHADVRRMLLRQKAIVEGSLALLGWCSLQADLSHHATDAAARERARLLLDLLTPIAKTFPAEHGFEANVLALQIHGGYGYSSEYLPEALLRDQKLNSIHEGTTQIQSLDLLGRKVVNGAALFALRDEILATCTRADADGVDRNETEQLRQALATVGGVTASLIERGSKGDRENMLSHATDYLELLSILVIGWMWTEMRARTKPGDFGSGIDAAARYWILTEIPKIAQLATLCESAERSFVDFRVAWL